MKDIHLWGVKQNNLKNISVTFPLNTLCVVSGVSGSGKTTLVKQILVPALRKIKGEFSEKVGLHKQVSGDIDYISQIELVDQNPIGKSSRSNPITYIKAWDLMRDLFAKQQFCLIQWCIRVCNLPDEKILLPSYCLKIHKN